MNCFKDIEYLSKGNQRQRQAYSLLRKLGVLEDLAEYDPTLIGTIPINIDIETSDLDIACCVENLDIFVERVEHLYMPCEKYNIYHREVRGVASLVCSFVFEGGKFEIFAQNVPIEQQYGYRHMLIEHRILQERGECFRNKVRALKQAGMKTEPAFAKLLGLQGDPYEELLKFGEA